MMKRRDLLTRTPAVVAIALALPAVVHGAAAKQRPNVLVIFADDLGYADLGVHGATDVRTPAIDSLARGGVRFSNGYTSSPLCSPSRAGLLTGRYQNRFGHEFNEGPFPHPPAWGLPLTEKTLADRLKAAGYATGLVGKWHLGPEAPFHPQRRGFDEFFGFIHASHLYLGVKPDSVNPILRGTSPVDEPEYLTDAFGREAVQFLDRHKDHPWFLYLAFNAVHSPYVATPKYLERQSAVVDDKRRTYTAMVAAMDDAIGRVLDRLQTLGLDERTLVFFVSDNGGPLGDGGRNGPLRGSKGQTWEGGIRVPFIFQWKGVVPGGRVYDHPVIHLDVFATALAAAGVSVRTAPPLDGVDLVPFVVGRKKPAPHDALYWRMGHQMAVRSGKWKLVKAQIRDTMPLPVEEAVAGAQLFDLARDPNEEHDVSAQNPHVVRKLAGRWKAWAARHHLPRWIRRPK